MSMSAPGSSSTPKQPSSESTQRGDSGPRDPPRPAGESPGAGQVEVLRKEMEAKFGALRDEIGTLRKGMDVRFEALQNEIGALRREMNAKVEALDSQFKTVRFMLGAVITLLVALLASQVALFVLVVNTALF